jgi:uncharacterized protein (TIGR00290 family)
LTTPLALSFSGGKDSVLALSELRASGQWDVRVLVSTFVENDRTLVMHEVPERLIALQASSLGLRLARVAVPRNPSNALYEARLGAALAALRDAGIRHVAFGDLSLTDIRTYRDGLLARLDCEAVYPLWQHDTRMLAARFVTAGFRAVTVCVDAARLDASWAGRDLDAAFVGSLPPGIDPCGENGEFHSFVHDGPGFAFRVRFERRSPVTRGGFHYAPLAPIGGEACARCGAVFECGVKAGVERCWCVDAPPIAVDPSLAGCLCPRCLRAEAQSGAPGRGGRA